MLPGIPGVPGGQLPNITAENKSSSSYGPVNVSAPFSFNAGAPQWFFPAAAALAVVLWWINKR